MGEYADDQFRREVRSRFGFDPGSMYLDEPRRIACKKCSKWLRSEQALKDHERDKHQQGGSK